LPHSVLAFTSAQHAIMSWLQQRADISDVSWKCLGFKAQTGCGFSIERGLNVCFLLLPTSTRTNKYLDSRQGEKQTTHHGRGMEGMAERGTSFMYNLQSKHRNNE
jgi:hypothetical protein